jgi:hypothetical protein
MEFGGGGIFSDPTSAVREHEHHAGSGIAHYEMFIQTLHNRRDRGCKLLHHAVRELPQPTTTT